MNLDELCEQLTRDRVTFKLDPVKLQRLAHGDDPVGLFRAKAWTWFWRANWPNGRRR